MMPLEDAIINNDINSVLKWLNFGVDANISLDIYPDSIFESLPLDFAVHYNNRGAIVRCLLNHGAKISPIALFEAIDNNDSSTVSHLLQFGANVLEKDEDNGTLLERAITIGNTAIVSALVKAGAELNQRDRFGKSFFYEPISHGQIAMVHLLITLGADVNCRDVYQATPLDYARDALQHDIFLLLEKNGAKSCKRSWTFISRYVDDNDSDDKPGCHDKKEGKPLDIYKQLNRKIAYGNEQDLERFIKSRAIDLNTNDEHNMSPLILAIHCGRATMTQLLIDAGADPNAVNSFGKTVLALAVEQGRTDIVRILLDAGANPFVTNVKRKALSPSYYARQFRHTEITSLIDKAIAKIENARSVVTHLFNPHRHVKIWLSKNKSVFMHQANQLRLLHMLTLCPKDDVYLIYDQTLLSNSAHDALKLFCLKHHIVFKDVRTDIFPFCQNNPLERDLIDIYEDEITHLETGGNLAAASDVLRWLAPIYSLGVYSDFDDWIDTRGLGKSQPVAGELILNLGSKITEDKINCRSCNDIIAVVDLNSPYITRVQEEIIKANQPEERQLITNIPGLTTKLPKKTLSSREYRNYICSVRNEVEAMLLQRLSKTNHFNTKNQTLHRFVSMIHDLDHEYLEQVVHATGPGPISLAIKSQQSMSDEDILKIAPLSLSSYYDLFCAFVSPQGGVLHINNAAQEKYDLFLRQYFQRRGDLSWTSYGEKMLIKQDLICHEQTTKIQASFRGFFARQQLKMKSGTSQKVICDHVNENTALCLPALG